MAKATFIYALGGDDIVVSSSGKDVVFGELGADSPHRR